MCQCAKPQRSVRRDAPKFTRTTRKPARERDFAHRILRNISTGRSRGTRGFLGNLTWEALQPSNNNQTGRRRAPAGWSNGPSLGSLSRFLPVQHMSQKRTGRLPTGTELGFLVKNICLPHVSFCVRGLPVDYRFAPGPSDRRHTCGTQQPFLP
jgi:hypothetical protein